MRALLCLGILLVCLCAERVHAQETSYMDLKIPVMDGAENIEQSKDETFYILTTRYHIVVDDLDQIATFYSVFFTEKGWKGFVPRVHPSRTWQSYGANIDREGNPNFSAGIMWQKKDFPVQANLTVSATDYTDGKFSVDVVVQISPQLDNSAFIKVMNLAAKDPENIFVLRKALGARPFELATVRSEDVPSDYKDKPIIIAYFEAVDKVQQNYKDFADQYIHHTKPIDEKFKQSFSFDDAEENTKESTEAPLHRWRDMQEEKAETLEVAGSDCGCKNGDEESEDPLYRWRYLQCVRECRDTAVSKAANCPPPTLWQCMFGQ